MTIGEKLRQLRGNKPRNRVAKDLGISYSMYMKIERDERNASDELKMRIAKYYGKTVQFIFFS